MWPNWGSTSHQKKSVCATQSIYIGSPRLTCTRIILRSGGQTWYNNYFIPSTSVYTPCTSREIFHAKVGISLCIDLEHAPSTGSSPVITVCPKSYGANHCT